MTKLSSLLWADFLTFIRWWKSATLVKLLVSLLFVGLFAFLSLLIYQAGYNFILPLTSYEGFGLMTAAYLGHASIIVALWLGIASSFAATYTFLVGTDPDLDLLLSYPVSSIIIILRLFVRSLFSSLFFSLIVFLPLGLAMFRIFGFGTLAESLFLISFLVFVVVISASIFGSLLAFIVANFHNSVPPSIYLPSLSILFVLATLFLIRYLLPSDLGRLYAAPPEQFLTIFESLPLNRYILPTSILTGLLFGTWSSAIYPTITGLTVILGIGLLFQASRLGSLRQRLASGQFHFPVSRNISPLLYNSHLSIAQKDVFSVLRTPSELGYGLFLLFLVLGFFFFLSSSISATSSADRLLVLSSYSLGWLFFYSIAYLIRLVFPLMAREGKTSWFIFTQAIRPGQILNQKVVASLLLTIPLFVISLFLWPYLSIGQGLWPTSFATTFFLSIATVLLGSLVPNFTESDSPEKTSTGFMGLLTLVVLLAISYLVINLAPDISRSVDNLLVAGLVGLAILVALKFAAVQAVKRYHF